MKTVYQIGIKTGTGSIKWDGEDFHSDSRDESHNLVFETKSEADAELKKVTEICDKNEWGNPVIVEIDVDDEGAFLESGDSRQTSDEVMEAILEVARGNATDAERIWADPKSGEVVAVVEIATKNGLIDPSTLCWGASGKLTSIDANDYPD